MIIFRIPIGRIFYLMDSEDDIDNWGEKLKDFDEIFTKRK